MEKSLIGTDVGPETRIDLKLVDGKIVVEVKYNGTDGFAALQAGLGPKSFLEKLKGIIPGPIDDMVIDSLITAFDVK